MAGEIPQPILEKLAAGQALAVIPEGYLGFVFAYLSALGKELVAARPVVAWLREHLDELPWPLNEQAREVLP